MHDNLTIIDEQGRTVRLDIEDFLETGFGTSEDDFFDDFVENIHNKQEKNNE